MADITGTPSSGAGLAGDVYTAANYEKFKNNQADVGREAIVSVTKSGSGNVTHAVLKEVIANLTLSGGDGSGTDTGGPDAFTVAAMGTANGAAFNSGTTTVVYLRVQGTGTIDTTAAAGSSGATVAVVAYFQPAL